jgi:hypothetical protein
MLKYSHPTLAWILDYWPITVFMPAILVLIATLALITSWWDGRDQVVRESVQSAAPAEGVVVSWAPGRRKPAPTASRPEQPLGGGHDARAAS